MNIGHGERPPRVSVAPDEEAARQPDLPVRAVGLVGLGLVGGSLARSLAKLEDPPRIVGMTRDDADAEDAVETGAVAEILTGPEGLAGMDLVVYAVPLSALIDLLPDHAPHLRGTVITDVASLKVPVVEAMESQGLGDAFVGGHPMTGGEGSGFSSSRQSLFRGAPIHLTSDTGSEEARHLVETFWRALGARPTWLPAAEHDRKMVWLSHLPQLVANALARALSDAGEEPEGLGPGGRDMTRLAASSPGMWRDLVSHAATLDAEALRVVAERLETMAGDLESGRFQAIEELMEGTRSWRRGGREG